MKKGPRDNKREIAKKSIDKLFFILEEGKLSDYNRKHVEEIKNIAKSFNIRLSREEKLKFCRNCNTYFKKGDKEIRLNASNGCVEHICKNCGSVRRVKYK